VRLPRHFANNGYRTAATGKIYHLGTGGKEKGGDGSKPEFQITAPLGGVGTVPPKNRASSMASRHSTICAKRHSERIPNC
jgi:arylsulfatase A-like enzyme